MLPIAFLLAAAATLFVIISLGQERIVQAMTGTRTRRVRRSARLRPVRGWPLQLISVQTLLPALLLVIIGEVARIRGALYYVVGGGAALAARAAADPPQPAGWHPGSLAGGVAGAGHGRASPAASSIGCSPAGMPDQWQSPEKHH